jgi:hypothetical protein
MVSNLLNLRIIEKKSGILLLNQRFDPLSDSIMNFPILKSYNYLSC